MARRHLSSPPWLPLLHAVAPVLALYGNNMGQAEPRDLVVPLAAAVLLTIALQPLCARLCRGRLRGAVVLALFWMVFFAYGHIASVIGRFPVAGVNPANPKALLPATALALGLCVRAIRSARGEPLVLARALLVAGAVMIASSLFNIVRYETAHTAPRAGSPLPATTITAGDVRRRPDIYYIIFDRYASAATLRDRYGFDNTPTVEFLRARGFYVADDSRSNYLVTAQSLASSLSMEHILPLTERAGRRSTDWIPVFTLIEENRVAAFLSGIGYRYAHVGSSWQPTARNPRADRNIEYRAMPEFTLILISTTAAYPVLYRMGISNPDREKYVRVADQLSGLPRLAREEKKPLFVFGHFLVPHGPFVFNADGSYRTPAQADAHNEHENYLAQVKYLNGRIAEVVDGILAAYPADNPPVIILQGDEGPYPARTQPHSFDWTGATDEEISEKMRILFAVHAPGCESALYPKITPVNLFRVIFNGYFGTGLPLLEDRSYAYRDLQHLYDFVETTSRIDSVGD